MLMTIYNIVSYYTPSQGLYHCLLLYPCTDKYTYIVKVCTIVSHRVCTIASHYTLT